MAPEHQPEGISAQTGKQPHLQGKVGKGPLRIPQGPGYEHARALLGKAVRVRRENAGLGQAAAAELLGVSERTLREWEQGRGSLWTGGPDRTMDHPQMAKLKEAYGCAASDSVVRNQYPGAPVDPAARKEYMIRRNALIQGNDPDEAVRRILGGERHDVIAKGS